MPLIRQGSKSATLPAGLSLGRTKRGCTDLYEVVQAMDTWTEGSITADDFFSPHYSLVFEPFLELMVGLSCRQQSSVLVEQWCR